MDLKSRKIDHINIAVPNLEKALNFYTKILKFDIKERYTAPDGMEFVFITDGSVVYELLEKPSIQKSEFEHIAYVSDDIEADYNYFKSLDSSIPIGEIGFADFLFENGVYYFFITAACGEKIEFCQRKG